MAFLVTRMQLLHQPPHRRSCSGSLPGFLSNAVLRKACPSNKSGAHQAYGHPRDNCAARSLHLLYPRIGMGQYDQEVELVRCDRVFDWLGVIDNSVPRHSVSSGRSSSARRSDPQTAKRSNPLCFHLLVSQQLHVDLDYAKANIFESQLRQLLVSI